MIRTKMIIDKLDEITVDLSVERILSELQVVIQRASFSHLSDPANRRDTNVVEAQIGVLFEGEISSEMLSYVKWLNENGMLDVVFGDSGIIFLNFFIKKYRNLTQVKFITPIVISENLRGYVRKLLLPYYPKGARIIFITKPSLVAGFVIDDGALYIDRSLSNGISNNLRSNIEVAMRGDELHG